MLTIWLNKHVNLVVMQQSETIMCSWNYMQLNLLNICKMTIFIHSTSNKIDGFSRIFRINFAFKCQTVSRWRKHAIRYENCKFFLMMLKIIECKNKQRIHVLTQRDKNNSAHNTRMTKVHTKNPINFNRIVFVSHVNSETNRAKHFVGIQLLWIFHFRNHVEPDK